MRNEPDVVYVACDTCFEPMTGILDQRIRDTCCGCGGESLVELERKSRAA